MERFISLHQCMAVPYFKLSIHHQHLSLPAKPPPTDFPAGNDFFFCHPFPATSAKLSTCIASSLIHAGLFHDSIQKNTELSNLRNSPHGRNTESAHAVSSLTLSPSPLCRDRILLSADRRSIDKFHARDIRGVVAHTCNVTECNTHHLRKTLIVA